jgi:hypothetical protein
VSGKQFNQIKRVKDKHNMKFPEKSTHYQICLEGKLEERWLRWFEGLEVQAGTDDLTVIRGEFDQSALHGLFNRIRDLGVTVISVQRHPDRKESSH